MLIHWGIISTVGDLTQFSLGVTFIFMGVVLMVTLPPVYKAIKQSKA